MKSLFQKSIPLLLVFGVVLCAGPASWSQKRQFQFEQFPVKVYQGPIKIPAGLHIGERGDWRDEDDHLVVPTGPKINFAGEYYLYELGCGTSCSVYELANLKTGANVPDISMFSDADSQLNTKDGHPYQTALYYRPNSRLLIAEYHLDVDDPNKTETCRQRYFVLENGKLRPISKTFLFCTEGDE
jgi:hypothetical protein